MKKLECKMTEKKLEIMIHDEKLKKALTCAKKHWREIF